MHYVVYFMRCFFFVFFFKQKTAYEMRISDWSSDVCSSDLPQIPRDARREHAVGRGRGMMGLDAGAIAQTIQLSVTPVFLLVATGSLLNAIAGRLARVVDLYRVLLDRSADTARVEHDRVVPELCIAGRRLRPMQNTSLN